jgi:oligopeptide transport system permease protein
MTAAGPTATATAFEAPELPTRRKPPESLWRLALRNGRLLLGGGMLLLILGACLFTLPWTFFGSGGTVHFNTQVNGISDTPPSSRYEYEREVTVAAPPSDTGPKRRRRGSRPSLGVTLNQPPAEQQEVQLQPISQPGFYANALPAGGVRLRWHLPQHDPAGPGEVVLERAPIDNFVRGDFTVVGRVDVAAASFDDTPPTTSSRQFAYRLRVENTTDAAGLLGTDKQGRSLVGRVLLGGVISLAVGCAAALISVVLGVGVGLLAGYAGGKVDAALMRFVDVMYGLPYLLLVIMFQVAFRDPMKNLFANYTALENPLQTANIAVLFLAIGLVSWLTMARVVRGQVLSLRDQPFVEAARAAGVPGWRIFLRHLLPNLVGPVIVYATLTVPQAILQESFLSFLGIGVGEPVPSWGTLAAEGLDPALFQTPSLWWQLVFPCAALAITLLSLNFLGDGLRDLFDPKREGAKL